MTPARDDMAALQPGEVGVVALGERRFAVHRDWGGLNGREVGTLSDCAALGDHLVVLARAAPALVVLDAGGAVVARGGEVLDGHGITADADGTLLVADRDAHQLLRLRADGTLVAHWGERHAPRWGAPFNHPTAAARAPDGALWVTDGYGNARLHRFDADGAYAFGVGELGEAPGAFRCPHAVAVAADGRIVVADRDNDRLQVFAPDGALLDVRRGFVRPMAVALDGEGWLWVTDQVPSLHRLALDGTAHTRARPAPNVPHGLAVAADGTVHLVEMSPPSVVRLRPLP